MTKMWRTIAATLLLSTATISVAQTSPVAGTAPAATSDVTATLHADASGPVYDRRIFTQFAEHLGNGIYGGLWVGKNSRIPNTRGFRNDVVAALKQLGVPVVRWPGGVLCRRISLAGRDRRQTPGQDQHHLGRRHRAERSGHA